MKKDTKTPLRVNHITITVLIFLILILSIFTLNFSVYAQEKEFIIIIKDQEENVISEILEGEYFIISALDPTTQEHTPYLSYVNISFNNKYYHIDDTRELILKAPNVEEDNEFIIIGSKEGYNNTYATILILNNITGKLKVIPEKYVVNAGDRFTVQVLDQNNEPISMVAVGIQNKGDFTDISYTDDEGRAWLTAPKESGIIKIIAQKKGYTQDLTSIEVNIIPHWWNEIINHPFFPILIAIIVLIIIIVIVHFRQKKSVYDRTKKLTEKKSLKKYEETALEKEKPVPEPKKDYYSLDNVRVQKNNDTKVEEIRISRPKKEKEVVSVKTIEDEIDKVIQKKKSRKHQHDWFIGHDELKYEIDKLTGEVDEDRLDKWYEGLDNNKEKINEKVKKKDKDTRGKIDGKT